MMDDKTFQALLGYTSAMVQAGIMLSKRLITIKEYRMIETKMCELFGIDFDSLYRKNDWIFKANNGNMAPTKEVL